jgi:hypothetical protein
MSAWSDANYHREVPMPRTAEMFPKLVRPRVVRMHMIDAGDIEGEKAARFACRKCGYEGGWMPCGITEIRRGVPCPNCNEGAA